MEFQRRRQKNKKSRIIRKTVKKINFEGVNTKIQKKHTSNKKYRFLRKILLSELIEKARN